MIGVPLQIEALVEHGRARHIQHAADDDPPGLTAGVHVHSRKQVAQSHSVIVVSVAVPGQAEGEHFVVAGRARGRELNVARAPVHRPVDNRRA